MSEIDYKQIINNLTQELETTIDGKPVSGMLYASMLAEKIQKAVIGIDKMEKTFIEAGRGDMFLDCPHCGSPVLLEFKNCDFCGTNLLAQNTTVGQEAVATKSEPVKVEEVGATPVTMTKEAKPKKEKKAAKETKAVTEAAPVEKEKVEEKATKVEKKVAKVETKENVKLPSVKELDAADYHALRKIVETLGLKTNNKDFQKVTPYRDAIKAEIELLRTPAVKEETVTPTKSETKAAPKAKPGKTKSGSSAATKSDTGATVVGKAALGAGKAPVDDEPLDEVDSTMDFDDSDAKEEVLPESDENDDDLDFAIDEVDDAAFDETDDTVHADETDDENWE